MIVTRQNISVTEQDRWKAGSEYIINEEVLKYFKANLERDERGYYIVNRWGERSEHGYLKEVLGFPLLAVDLDFASGFCKAMLDGGQEFELFPGDFFMCDDVTAGFFFRRIPVRLSVRCMAALSPHLSEDSKGFLLMDQRLQLVLRPELFPMPVI